MEAHGDGADGGTPKRSLVGLHEKVFEAHGETEKFSPVRSTVRSTSAAKDKTQDVRKVCLNFLLDKHGNIMYNIGMKTTQTGKNLTRLNITLPTDLWEWLKSQGKKGNVSASYFLARLVEREKIISEITEKRQK